MDVWFKVPEVSPMIQSMQQSCSTLGSTMPNFSKHSNLPIVFTLGLICILGESHGSFVLKQSMETNARPIEFRYQGEYRLSGDLGVSLPSAVGEGTEIDCNPTDPLSICRSFGDFANVTITDVTIVGEDLQCARVEWASNFARRLEDCYNINDGEYFYGGAETLRQHWPNNEDKKQEAPYITADFLQTYEFGDVIETYWLFSNGAAIHVDEENPLFISWDTKHPGQLCFVSADEHPYENRDQLELSYTVCVGENLKTVHQKTFPKFYKKPLGLPDEVMLIRPFWSTWAQYKTEVNQSIVIEYAQKLVDLGFELSSHVEIDDKWETCYGEEEFDPVKFPDPAAMVEAVKALNFRVTLWVTPFVNFGCPLFETGVFEDYFINDRRGKPTINRWWQSDTAGIIDTNNERAVTWWRERLDRLRTNYGIDSFKFDAGEANWLPPSLRLEGDPRLAPNIYTTKYVEAVAPFGGLVEVRTGHRSQEHAIFTRMLDKLSHWGYDAGLQSMIPTALQFGILGYPFVLPDMIGGNAYGNWPSKELYIRWLEVNLFMPAVQFSIVPWDVNFDQETIDICKKILAIRETYRDEILAAANQAVLDGSPINRPLWWYDPTDPETLTIDQEYMLGDSILVAPVVLEGEVSRDIYLPVGTWRSGVDNATFTGPTWVMNYSAPLDVVPFFIKVE